MSRFGRKASASLNTTLDEVVSHDATSPPPARLNGRNRVSVEMLHHLEYHQGWSRWIDLADQHWLDHPAAQALNARRSQ